KEAQTARVAGTVSIGSLTPVKIRVSLSSAPRELKDFSKLTALATNAAVHEELRVTGDTARELSSIKDEYLLAAINAYRSAGLSTQGIRSGEQVRQMTAIAANLDNQFAAKIE